MKSGWNLSKYGDALQIYSRTTGISISEDEALHVVLEIDNRHISDKNGVGAVAGEV